MSTHPNPSPTPYQVLFVDDKAADMRLIEEAIHFARLSEIAEATTCPTADCCWEQLERSARDRHQFHLIMLDLSMPGLSGLDLLQRIRADRRYDQVPVFMFTNSDSPYDRRDCLELGADLFIQKPYDFMDHVRIFEAIRHSLHTHGTVEKTLVAEQLPGQAA